MPLYESPSRKPVFLPGCPARISRARVKTTGVKAGQISRVIRLAGQCGQADQRL